MLTESNFFTFHFSFFIFICTFAPAYKKRALSSAGLEHLPYKQRVGGSNPSAPTKKESFEQRSRLSFFWYICSSFAGFIVKYQKKTIATVNSSLFTLHFSLLFCTFALAIERLYIAIYKNKVLEQQWNWTF